MQWPEKDRTLALAGIFQAAQIIKQLAMYGKTDETAFYASLNSILKIDAPDVISIFGDLSRLHLGLFSLRHFCDSRIHQHEALILRHVLNMLAIGKRILQNKTIAQQLQRRLIPVISQATHLSPDNPLVLNHLSTIYQKVLLAHNLRIPVQGRRQYLMKTEIADKIRVMLLAGIRSGVLWFQVGGSRWQLLFQRARLQSQVEKILHDRFYA